MTPRALSRPHAPACLVFSVFTRTSR
jgi:hypothetical protein